MSSSRTAAPRRPKGGDRSPRRVNSLGSGFVIDADGIVVTNNHVIADADEITVIFNDGSKLKAEFDRQGFQDRPRGPEVKPDKRRSRR